MFLIISYGELYLTFRSTCVTNLICRKFTNMPTLPPGNSIWPIPSSWLYKECNSSGSCSIYKYEVIKPNGQKGACGSIIGTIDVDINRNNDELISLYDFNYQLSILPYLTSSMNVRRALTITNNQIK